MMQLTTYRSVIYLTNKTSYARSLITKLAIVSRHIDLY